MYGKPQEYPQYNQGTQPGYNQPYPEQPANPAYQQVPQADYQQEQQAQQYDPYGADGLSRKLSGDTRIGFIRKVLGILSV